MKFIATNNFLDVRTLIRSWCGRFGRIAKSGFEHEPFERLAMSRYSGVKELSHDRQAGLGRIGLNQPVSNT
ncbi:MAG: hypothetical protein DWH73_03795 [Planctomycetota bacterium]|nr:MAG: hypothetical protein DWH73_03795 [Planctomycetota bacterium]